MKESIRRYLDGQRVCTCGRAYCYICRLNRKPNTPRGFNHRTRALAMTYGSPRCQTCRGIGLLPKHRRIGQANTRLCHCTLYRAWLDMCDYYITLRYRHNHFLETEWLVDFEAVLGWQGTNLIGSGLTQQARQTINFKAQRIPCALTATALTRRLWPKEDYYTITESPCA